MEKIIVIGCPGSGKSRFSRELHRKMGIPLYHLDMLYWNPDKTTVEKSVFLERLAEILEQNEWIVDGNYGSTMELRIKACDTVFFLDYPTEICLDGIRERRGLPRTDMPWIETEEDEAFVTFIKSYNTQEKPKVLARLEKYPDKRVIVFTGREQADDFLSRL